MMARRAIRPLAKRLACFLVALAAVASTESAFSEEKDESRVPLRRVVMFNSGVGFFEHGAEIEGNATVELKFNVNNVNDLLKSMVLQDLGGGKISTVTYGSKDPITKTLKTFAIDLTTNPTLGDLLRQIRGEKVAIDAPNAIEGTIVGVETRKQPQGEQTVEVEYLNLLTDEGLRSVPLASVGRIKLVNAQLDAELRQALMVLALGHSTDKKTVTLNFLGEGRRPVRVGYIQEAPIWKTSYRLVLKDDEEPFLQGWAIVENTTEEDWQDVSLTLVSGRPISFVMDLYQPLYLPRPVVVPELFASLRPQVYNQDLAAAEGEFQARGERAEAPAAPAEKRKALRDLAEAKQDRAANAVADAKYKEELDIQQGVQSVAQAGDVGELFQYAIDTPVTLPRQQSAMLPIVNGSVKGEKVSIYNPQVHAKHPLNGLKFTNATGLHLMQGPITVFDGGTYAGDAQIDNLAPGTERLLSYAMDLDTEVAVPEVAPSPEQLVNVRLVKGVLHTSNKLERGQNYTVKNSGNKAKKVLIEYPLDANWTLISPEKPEEKTRDRYRFAVQAEPGKPAALAIREEMVVYNQVQLTNLDDGTIQFYVNAKAVSEAIKTALAEVLKRKREIEALAQQRQQLEQQIVVIGQEQDRIRQNMAQLDKNSDLYNRYVKKFGQQEDQVDKVRGQIQEKQAEETAKRQALDEYLVGLDLK